ncbi:MAG: ATP-dependent RecD-like DNA helicase, partial [Alphaproteobacteria bacterium]
ASGIESDTVARFIHSQKGINSEPAMYVVDEASMLSIKDMDSLMNRIDNNARLVLIGDVKQLQSIGAGKIFSTLQSEKAINTVVMSESKRQVEQLYKKSVQKMAEKITSEAFNLLDKSGKILEIKDRDERLMLIANKYCERHKDTILVTATNRDCQELNNIIRWKLQKEGKIGTGDIGLIMREQKTIIEEQRFFYQSYNINDLVVVNTDILGKAGLEGNITYIDKKSNSITIKDKNNNNYDINLSKDGADLSVYTEKLKQFTHGDKIVFLKNDKGLGISNGQTATIQEIDCNGKAKLTLDNGKTQTINLSKQYKYVAHGYALTDYKAQGQTAKVVIYHADTYNVVNFNQAYVGITRGKEDIAIFTDDKVMFKEMIEKEQEKTTIHEFERNEKKLRIKNKADYNKPNITQKYNNF